MTDSTGYFRELHTDPHQGTLTPAELAVVKLLSHGYTVRMCAEQLGKGQETVRSQIASGKARVSAKTPAHLVAVALRHGLID